MSELLVERIGGFAGFGLPGSKIKSQGRCDASDLSQKDQLAIEKLFEKDDGHPPGTPDEFRYRITRRRRGRVETVEAPESALPKALISTVKDELL